MTPSTASPRPEPALAPSSFHGDHHAQGPSSACPLCGSKTGQARIETNTVALVECPACVGHGMPFWLTIQAAEAASRLRADGHVLAQERLRSLLGIRAGDGGIPLVRQSDLTTLFSSA